MKFRMLLTALLVFAFAKAQSPVTTVPATPTQTDAVKLVFNAVGTDLENSTTDLYAYTGLTINGERFQNIIVDDFFENNGAPKFTKTGANTYELDITPSINEFYNVQQGDVVTEIFLVVRNSNGSRQTRPDIFLPVFEPGLNALITSPERNTIFEVNQSTTITAESSQSADLTLSVNGNQIAAVTGTSISSSYTFPATGNYTFEFAATTASETATNSISVFVPNETVNKPRPTGLKNGVNENADGSVTFLLAAPLKSDAVLIGSFTNWDLNTDFQMNKDGDYFWITVPASNFTANTSFQYQYLIDYDIRIADPFSTLILDPFNDSFISDSNYPNLPEYPTGLTVNDVTLYTYQATPYNWTVTDFQRPDNENLVIYELLVRDFSEDDSYQSIIDNIDYIVDLGVNAVEFMPLNEFEGNDSWGYNPKFHGALDKAYGPPAKLKELIDLLHANGIAAIVDVVYNHSFGQSPLVQMWPDGGGFNAGPTNPYLNQNARHPFNVGTDFNHESPWTKQYVKQTMQYFLDEYKFDGFRFDLSKGFTQTNTGNDVGAWGRRDDSRIAILNEYKSFLLANNDDDIYLILEHLSDNEEEKILADSGFMLWGKMSEEYKQNSLGYSSNSSLQRAYFTSRGFNEQHLVSYAESHDEERIMYETLRNGNNAFSNYQVRSLPVALDRQEAIAAIQYSIPGPKMLWQFGELGYDISINASASNPTCTTCRTDRKPVPFTNGYASDAQRLDLYEKTSEMIKLKVKYPETFNNTNNFLEVSGGLVKRIELRGPEFDAIVLANFDVTPKQIAPKYTKTGTWYDYFEGTSSNVTNQNATVSIPAGGYKIFTSKEINTTASSGDTTGTVSNIQLYPNPTQDTFEFNVPVKKVIVRSITGQTVKIFDEMQARYDVSNLVTGMYIIDAYDLENNRSSIKLIKN
ncbi:alpha amylase [Nonlabens sp. YIK11]|uniref:alpha-amylase family glycosyl hydrolase n=1 Tax=Nonlabens sp. YIK11 TaxID=1453349 RepID=UPI0006DC45D8|nr:alpha-amylase family glycosyl hydrolase [Nonlabens sp. YIK11]KQC32002.1 alpha amylase [Nonlabens sp. YIK11]